MARNNDSALPSLPTLQPRASCAPECCLLQASGLGALQSVCFDKPGRDAARGKLFFPSWIMEAMSYNTVFVILETNLLIYRRSPCLF